MVENFKINETNHCGKCPECDFDWDKGEVIDVLREARQKMIKQNEGKEGVEETIAYFKDEEFLKQDANKQYGWTPENKLHISKLLKIEPTDSQQWNEGMSDTFQCPNCFIAWDSVSGQRTDKYKIMITEAEAMIEYMAKLKKDLDAKKLNS